MGSNVNINHAHTHTHQTSCIVGNSSRFGPKMSKISLTDIASRVYFWTDDHGRKLKCSAPLYFDYAMSYVQDLLTDEDVFPTRAGKETSYLSTCSAGPFPLSCHLSCLLQVPYFRQASSFLCRRCFCCFSGLLLIFTGLTTKIRWCWACTPTSTRSSHTSPSSAGSMPCWSPRTLSLCRT